MITKIPSVIYAIITNEKFLVYDSESPIHQYEIKTKKVDVNYNQWRVRLRRSSPSARIRKIINELNTNLYFVSQTAILNTRKYIDTLGHNTQEA